MQITSFRFTVIMTESCNLACKYCYVPHNLDKMTKISKDVIDATLKFAETKFAEGWLGLDFDLFGGEALLAEDEIKYFIEKSVPLNNRYPNKIKITIFTNGTLLRRDFLEYTKNYGFVRYNFSLDGCEEAHNSARVYSDGTGSYEDVMRGIDLYKEVYEVKSDVSGKIVISPENVKYTLQTAKMSMDRGLHRLSFGLNRDDVWDEESISVYKEQLKLLADFYVENMDRGLWYDIFAIPIMDLAYTKNSYCGAGKTGYGISPEGGIFPCQRFVNNRSPYKLGDVFNGLDLKSKGYLLFKGYSVKNFLSCSSCSTFTQYNCLGQCIAAMHEAGNIFKPIKSICEIHKYNLKLAQEIDSKLRNNPQYLRTLDPDKYGG